MPRPVGPAVEQIETIEFTIVLKEMPEDLEKSTKEFRAALKKRADFVSLELLADGYRIKLRDQDTATAKSIKKALKTQGMAAKKIDQR